MPLAKLVQPELPLARRERPAVLGEVRWAVEQEGAVTREDLYYRRTRIPLFDVEPRAAIEPLAKAMAACMGWSADTTAEQVRGVVAQFESDLNFI